MSLRICFLAIFCLTYSHASSGELQISSSVTGSNSLAFAGKHPFFSTADQIHNARLIGSENDRLQSVVWDVVQANGSRDAYFAVLRKGVVQRVRKANYALSLHAASFDPLKDVPQADLPGQSSYTGMLYVVQYFNPAMPAYADQIRAWGGEVVHFLPNYAAVVVLNETARQLLVQADFVRWLGPYQPAWRLEPFLIDHLSDAESAYASDRYNILLTGETSLLQERLFPRIQALGGIEPERRGKRLMAATLTHDQLFAVAALDEVLFIDRLSPYEADMDVVRELMGANALEAVAGYTGEGVRGEAFDLGFNLGHVDFQNHPLITHTNVSSHYHGAAVSGICFGDGTGNASARGLLPDGQGIVADANIVFSGIARYDHTGELLQPAYEAVFQTSSVGSSRTLHYTNISAEIDTLLFDWDILHCQSQSNAKTRFSRPEAWAKNVVSGGAFRHQDTLSLSDDCWDCSESQSGGSIGPAEDGRIKPDLAAFYDFTFTTTEGSATAYANFGGTSGATPTICGHFGLFFQMWADGIFGNPVVEGSVFDNKAHLTTAKAMMINSASQFDFEGETHDFTRTHQGWGRPDVQRLYEMRNKVMVVDETDRLLPFEIRTYAVAVAPGETELRATMVFLDPPGNPASAQARVNDLSLRVTSPSGVVYWGNWGLRRYPFSVPGGFANTIDTVENVWVGNPEAGTWQVEVLADEINMDGHTETPEVDADFALVVSGVSAETVPLNFALDTPPKKVAPGSAGQVSLSISDGSEILAASSPTLHVNTSGGPFSAQAMVNLGGGLYRASLPVMTCGETATYYFSAQTLSASTVTWPANGAAAAYETVVGNEVVLFEDDFETASGWSVGVAGDTATSGLWERGRPLSRNDQPAVDHSVGGLNCYFTQQELDSSTTSVTNDVNGGATSLVSPVFDLTGQTDVIIGYWLWYSNHRAGTQDDVFTVQVSNDSGSTWTTAKEVGPSGLETKGGWHYNEFSLESVTTPGPEIRFRFIAADNHATSRVEAALDDFSIVVRNCVNICLSAPEIYGSWPESNILQIIDCQ